MECMVLLNNAIRRTSITLIHISIQNINKFRVRCRPYDHVPNLGNNGAMALSDPPPLDPPMLVSGIGFRVSISFRVMVSVLLWFSYAGGYCPGGELSSIHLLYSKQMDATLNIGRHSNCVMCAALHYIYTTSTRLSMQSSADLLAVSATGNGGVVLLCHTVHWPAEIS